MNVKMLKTALCAVLASAVMMTAFSGCGKNKEEIKIDPVKVSDSDISKVETDVDDTLRENEFVGSASITINNQDIYSKSFGYADAVKNKKLNENSVFAIGALTQNITGVAVLMLNESGKLSLDDTLDKYFKSKYSDITGVTVEQLLANTVSFGAYTSEIYSNYEEQKMYSGYLKSDNSDKYSVKISEMIVDHILRHGYTKKAVATNSNYYLLGKIITKASGTSYREYVQKNIFDKLGMKRTGFVSGKYKLAGYDMNNKIWRRFNEFSSGNNFGFMYSSAGVVSCSRDLAEFYKAIVNNKLGNIDYLKCIKLAPSNKYCGFIQDGNNITASARLAVHCAYVHINLETKEAVSMMSNRVGKTDIKNTGDELYKIISSKINGIILSGIKKS